MKHFCFNQYYLFQQYINKHQKMIFKSFIIIILLSLLFITQNKQYKYGKHTPHGWNSFKYLTNTNHGTWKVFSSVIYAWNYFNHDDNPLTHPFDKKIVAQMANGNTSVVSRDSNKHLMLDFNLDGQIDKLGDGRAYYHHNGKGKDGKVITNPSSIFWYDDNILGSIINQVYGMPKPGGIPVYKDKIKWNVLRKQIQNWKPYNRKTIIQSLLLDSLYYLSVNKVSYAVRDFTDVLKLTKANLANNARYTYSARKNTDLALMAILSQFLFQQTLYPQYLNHYISLRTRLLETLERSGNQTLSWRTYNQQVDHNYLSTQSMILGTLALSVGGDYILEVGKQPLKSSNQSKFVYNQKQFYYSAIQKQSLPGYMFQSADLELKNGLHTIQIIGKCPFKIGGGTVGRLQIIEQSTKTNVTKLIKMGDFRMSGWSSLKYGFKASEKSWDFRFFWVGNITMDIAILRIQNIEGITLNDNNQDLQILN